MKQNTLKERTFGTVLKMKHLRYMKNFYRTLWNMKHKFLKLSQPNRQL